MSAGVETLPPGLKRIIVLRQTSEHQWKVEAYELQARGWRFTWLLNPDESERGARWYARMLARRMGLPVGEQRLGERVRLVHGMLGKAA